jgi:MFS family permease
MTTATRLILARGLRGLVDGLVSVVLAPHLLRQGFSLVEVGAMTTVMLLGSAAETMGTGLIAHRVGARTILLAAGMLMSATGVAFGTLDGSWLLFAAALIGTVNPTGGDLSLFLPTEQAVLATVAHEDRERTALYARYNLVGAVTAAAGTAVGGLLEAAAGGVDTAGQLAFALYAVCGLAQMLLHRGVPRRASAGRVASRPLAQSRRILAQSRRIVVRLAALFSLDSFGGGFAVQALLVVWLAQRFDMPPATSGAVLGAAALLGGLSQLVSAALAARIGLVPTMVFTHLPANFLLVLAGIAPSASLAVTFLLLRAALSQMDVPARQALVMSLVPPEERAAAASFTNVPRSLAGGIAPLFAGWMLATSSFGWPLILGGVLKAIYDLLLLAEFRHTSGRR